MENKTAVIYARTSSAGAMANRQNTTRQVEDLKEFAKRNNLGIAMIYEEHISGCKKNSERIVLTECIEYCKNNHIDYILISELSRLGRNTFEVMATVQDLIESHINVYMQKEQFTLLDNNGKPSAIAAIMIAVLGTCAQLERENIQYRLNSGRAQYIRSGGKLGRKVGYRKPLEKKEQEYAEVLRLISKRYYTLKEISKLTGKSVSTIQRLKKEFCPA